MRLRSQGWRAGSLIALSALGLLGTLFYLCAGLDALTRVREAELSDALAVDQPENAARTEPRAVGAAILARNIFDSQTGPMAWEEAPLPVVKAASEPVDTQRASALSACTSADLRLVASIVKASHPERSFAALRRGGRTHIVPIGRQVDDVSLLALFPTSAHVRVGDQEPCAVPVYLAPDQRGKPEPTVIHVATRPTARGKSGFKPQELAKEIRPLGGSRYRVSRVLLFRALASPRAAGRGARLQPVERHGNMLGFALSRVGKNSLLAHLGLEQGDLLRAINGHELVDLAGMRAALRLLRKNDSITLSVMRNNVPHNLQYTLD